MNIPITASTSFRTCCPTSRRTRAASRASSRVDERMVVPVGAVVKMIVTSNDVIHAWGVPAFWTKIDAVPGRLNETWFRADRPGVYYGVCYELCGARHGYMPIAVEVVPASGSTRGSPRRAATCRAPQPARRRPPRRRRGARPGRTAGEHEPPAPQRRRPPIKRATRLRRQEHHDRHHCKRRPFRGRR